MRLFISFSFIFFSLFTYSQYLPNEGYIETGSLVGFGKEAPFWLHSNRFGQFSNQKTNLYFKTGLVKNLDTAKRLDFSYGLDLFDRYNKNQLYLHQAYFKIKYRFINIHFGKIEEHFGEQDTDLSSGNLLWSGNTRLVPKVALSIPEFIPVFKGYIDIKGYIAHGWMNDNRYVKNYYLHHKNAYIRLGSKFPISFSYGLEHFAQWGGTSPEFGPLPKKISDYKYVFFAKAGGPESPWLDTMNRLGNHLGSKNFTLEIKTNRVFARFYWQYMFEDASKSEWENISDGLWGISIDFKEKRIIRKIVFEYINTTDQSGPIHLWNDTIKLGGQDQYFNNRVYENGWKYYDRIIGTPFITPETSTNQVGTNNNCIKAWHFGLLGLIKNNIHYRIFITHVRNYGIIIPNIGTYIYSYNPVKENTSVLVETKYDLKNDFHLQISFAFDVGSINNTGAFIVFQKKFLNNKKSRNLK